MESTGHSSGLASIVSGGSGISATKTVGNAQNNSALLQSLTTNTILRGIVQSRGANNIVTVKTDQGTIALQTDVFLKRGSEIALKVEQRAAESLIRIVSVNGQSLGKYLESLEGNTLQPTQDKVATSSNLVRSGTGSTSAEGATTQQTATAQAASTQPNIGNTSLRGVFLSAPTLTPAQQAAIPQSLLPAVLQAGTGTSLQLNIVSIQMPNPSGTGFIPLAADAANVPLPTGSSQATAATNPASYITPTQRLAADPSVQAALQNQQASQTNAATLSALTDAPDTTLPAPQTQQASPSQSAVTVNTQTQAPTHSPAAQAPTATSQQPIASAPQTPTTPQTSQPQQTAAQQPTATTALLTATVLSSSNPRELTVQSDVGTLKLFVTTPLPKGSVITFSVQHIAQVRGGGQVAVADTVPLPSQLPAMEELTDFRHAITAQNIPSNFIPSVIPRPGPALTTEIVFLMTALTGGDMRKWVGDDQLKQLERGGKRDLLPLLTSEFSALKSIPAESRDGQWHHTLIPIYAESAVKPVQLYYKGQRQEQDNQQKDTDHFMVDLELTRMGRMQLDGLVQKSQQTLQFDLIIRTEQSWPSDIQDNIRDIYLRAQEISGFRGSISFRHGGDALMELPVTQAQQAASNRRSLIV